MSNSSSLLTPRMVADFCRKRISAFLPPRELDRLQGYMLDLLGSSMLPPMVRGAPDWSEIAAITDIDADLLRLIGNQIRPGLDAVIRAIGQSLRRASRPRNVRHRKTLEPDGSSPAPSATQSARLSPGRRSAGPRERPTGESTSASKRPKRKTGYAARQIVEFPEPLWVQWEDPETFSAALSLHMDRHGDTAWHLHRAITREGDAFDRRTIITWLEGQRAPRSSQSLEILDRIERRYRLPEGYFKAKFPHRSRATSGYRAPNISPAEQRRLAWHLPDDFEDRPPVEQEEILTWVRSRIISGTTDYRRFQAAAMRQHYAVRFRDHNQVEQPRRAARLTRDENDESGDDLDLISGIVDAPPELEAEMSELLRFKTATLAAFGFQRNGVWGDETAAQKVEHLGLMFGALTAGTKSAVRGRGVPTASLSFGMLVFPAVWDWYVQWRERRRGFYTAWEVDMMRVAAALTRAETGWMRQSHGLAERLRPIAGLISAAEVAEARANWAESCELMHKHALNRAKEIQRVARVHRDPFEPILPVLEAQSPVGEYRKITDEILRLMPDERFYGRAAAESARSFLLLRLGLHLGLRQKNLRQLMVCPRGGIPRTERQLVELNRGELRWSERDAGWEVLIPSIAFKNSGSSFFGSKPFRLVLPDLGGLNAMIDAYITRHRPRLLARAADPGHILR